VFKRQYKKRLTFYKKNNYKINESDNINYFKDIWKNPQSSSKKKSKCLIKILE